MERGQVTVAIKGVEVGAQGRISPDTFGGFAGARFSGCRLQGDDLEAILHRLKGFMAEE